MTGIRVNINKVTLQNFDGIKDNITTTIATGEVVIRFCFNFRSRCSPQFLKDADTAAQLFHSAAISQIKYSSIIGQLTVDVAKALPVKFHIPSYFFNYLLTLASVQQSLKTQFRATLLRLCQQEFQKKNEERDKHKRIGNFRFLGELFNYSFFGREIIWECLYFLKESIADS